MKRWFPWILCALCAAWFLSGARAPARKNGFDTPGWGRLPALINGRVQPLDSVARNSLLSVSGRSTVPGTNGDSLSATDWLLEAMTQPSLADQRKIFRIQHPDLEGLLGSDKIGLNYYSFDDLAPQLDSLVSQARKMLEAEAAQSDGAEQARTPFQRDLAHLYESLVLYTRLKSSLGPEGDADFARDVEDYQRAIGQARAATREHPEGAKAFGEFYAKYSRVAGDACVLAVPPPPDQPGQLWMSVGASLTNSTDIQPAVKYYAEMSSAVNAADPARFNKALVQYRVWLQENGHGGELSRAGQEYFFSQIDPLDRSMTLYLAAAILGCAYWLRLSETVRRSGFALLALAFVIHTFGLGFRMHLEGRPPVTNLYSSAVFIGWAAALLGMALEWIFNGGIGLACAGFIGFVTLIIAHHLALSGDTMEMLRAVLDTNLWLSTHVVTVTIGYSAMFVAGLLAVIAIVRRAAHSLSAESSRALARMVYGIVCFATLFSFAGTVLGGIWADQSWGRFWGWDPKENGALLIVIWNAMILHARWAGMIHERGLMIMAVMGNIITSFSWFGVNMLGVGLHSYGFMDRAFPWLMAFDISQVALIALAFIRWPEPRPAVATA